MRLLQPAVIFNRAISLDEFSVSGVVVAVAAAAAADAAAAVVELNNGLQRSQGTKGVPPCCYEHHY